MIRNYDFPWYLQNTSSFLALYDGFFNVAATASPLDLEKAFNIDEMSGQMLYYLGVYWGLSGSLVIWDGLIYDVDKWTSLKVWTGTGEKELSREMYANIIKAKAYAYGNPYSLNTIKEVFARVFANETYSLTVAESDMEITLTLSAAQNVLESFIEARAYDLSFIGKPAGIKVNWVYSYTN